MNIKLIEVVKKIPKLFINTLEMMIYKIISVFHFKSNKYKNAWLFCERGTEAKDNAYHLFKYIRINHPKIKAYYLIDSSFTKDFNKVKKLGNIIEYDSFEHKMLFLKSKYHISTHMGYITKYNYKLYNIIFNFRKKQKYVFLQHGITQADLSDTINSLIHPLNIFVTSTENEYKSIINNKKYGFDSKVVKLTGLARFDNLNQFKTENIILFMPTWRNYILSPSYTKQRNDLELFLNSEYYKNINNLLNDETIINILKNNNLKLVFYPHYEIQKFLKHFTYNKKYIIIANKETNDVQTLLKKCKLLITDYSSVFFDVGYMKKPMIFYQFDKDDFQKFQYSKGYFSYNKHAFGKVVENKNDISIELKKIIKNNYNLEKNYLNRVIETFKYIDAKNCERIYNEIKKL